MTLYSHSQPCLEGWKYRREIQIQTVGSTNLSDFQLRVDLDMVTLINTGKLQVNGSDLRILAQDGTVLAHWIEPQSINTTNSSVWIRVPNLTISSITSIYLFYGNEQAPTIANGFATFELFDDFDNQAGVNPLKWSSCGTVQVSNGKCRFTSTASSNAFLSSSSLFASPVQAEMHTESATGGGYLGMYHFATSRGYGLHYENQGGLRSMSLGLISNHANCYHIGSQIPDAGALSANSILGKWSYARTASNNRHLLDWAGAVSHPISRTETTIVGYHQLVVGNGAQSGNLVIDWIFLRKYADVDFFTTLQGEVAMSPVIEPVVNTPLCQGDTARFHLPFISSATYSWVGPNGFNSDENSPEIANVSPLMSGEYTVEITIPNGCRNLRASVMLQVDPTSTSGNMLGSSSACEGANSGTIRIENEVGRMLFWETSTSGFAPWQTVTSTLTDLRYTNLTKTTYFRAVMQSGVCAIVRTDSAQVEIAPRPVGGKVIGPAPACLGSDMGFLDLIGHDGNIVRWEYSTNGFTTFSIIDSTTASIPVPALTQTTSFRAQIGSGSCPSVYSIPYDVIIYPRPLASYTPPEGCDGDVLQFENTSSISAGVIQGYLWDFGDQQNSVQESPNHLYFNSGVYSATLTATSTSGCRDDTVQTIHVYEQPVANFLAENVCFGEETRFQNQSSIGGGILGYLWDFGDSTVSTNFAPTHRYEIPTNYSVKLLVSSDRQCVDSLIRIISVFHPPIVLAWKDTTISKGFGVQLLAQGAENYVWSPQEGLNDSNNASPLANPNETTVYAVTGIDKNGCSGIDTLTITVRDDFRLDIPNVLTPDGNGENDTWVIRNIQSYSASVEIYNRLGKRVFQSENYQNNWSGLDGKDILPDGSYYYVISFPDSEVMYRGAVSIFRNK